MFPEQKLRRLSDTELELIRKTEQRCGADGLRRGSPKGWVLGRLSEPCEREQLTYAFLALIKEKAIEEADRNIILSGIFSGSDTGPIKGEATPHA
jgi:hypothetical protein